MQVILESSFLLLLILRMSRKNSNFEFRFYFQVKGISISQFYNNERHQAETFETGFYGYRGLTGKIMTQ
jgi:hypothetical protein